MSFAAGAGADAGRQLAGAEVQAMAGPGDGIRAGRGHLRASHADRDGIAGILKAAFVRGMLDQGEFTLRVGQALTARTHADLAALTADLPADLHADPPPWPWSAGARLQPPGLRPRRWIAVATVLYAAVWAYVLLAPNRGGYPAAPMLVIGGFCAYLSVWVIGLGEMALDRQFRRSAGHPPRPSPAP
ncbi:MAG TPA: DUF1707 domain-containing protein [Streptosporangiaceae bacterium]|jgi:hypothetical protein